MFLCFPLALVVGSLLRTLVCSAVIGTILGRMTTTTRGSVSLTVFPFLTSYQGNTGDIGSFLSRLLAKSARHCFLVPDGSVSHA